MALYDRKVTLRSRPAGALAINYFGADDANKISDHTEGWINVKEAPYNAVGDSNTNDGAAIAAAITAGAGKTIYIPDGTYNVDGFVFTVPPYTRVVGASRKGTRLLQTSEVAAIFIMGHGSEIRDLMLWHGGTTDPTSGAMISVPGPTRTLFEYSTTKISNVEIIAPWEGIRADDYTGPFPTELGEILINLSVTDVIMHDIFSAGLVLRHVADAHIHRMWVDGGATKRGQGIRFEDFCEGIEIVGAEVIYCDYGIVIQSQAAGGSTGREYPAANHIANSFFDSCTNDGAYLYGGLKTGFTNVWFSGNGRNGVTQADESWGNRFVNCIFYANQAWGLAHIGVIASALRLTVADSLFSENWIGGVTITGDNTHFNIQGNQFSAQSDPANPHTSDYGVWVRSGVSDYYVIADNAFLNMSTANVLDSGSGTNKRVEQNPAPSGGGLIVASIPSASRPTPDAGNAGTFIRVRDTDTSETLEMCLQNSDGSYSWTVVATAPV